MFAPYCERFGVVLVVPRYTPEQHSDYQRLGRLGRGVRADQVLDKCLAEVSLLTGADTTQFNLFGYSGGAQFAHRYLMAHPHRIAKAALVAAGWYTFPDHTEKFPYGIRPTRRLPDVVFNPEEFLHVPVDVFVGELDRNTKNLRKTKRTLEQQGKNRLERGRNWVAAMQIAGNTYGIETAVTFTSVPNTDHSFLRFCRRGALVKRVFKSLFGVTIEPPQKADRELLDDLDLSARQLFGALKKEIAVVTGKQS